MPLQDDGNAYVLQRQTATLRWRVEACVALFYHCVEDHLRQNDHVLLRPQGRVARPDLERDA